MKKTFFTAAFAALALSAQAIVTPEWTQTNTSNRTLNLTNGCGTVVALISTANPFTANRASIFTVRDGLAGSGTGTTFRMAGGDGSGNGNLIGVTSNNTDTLFKDGASTVTTSAGGQYLLSIVYDYDAGTQTQTATCYIGDQLVYTLSAEVSGAPGSYSVANINSYPALSFFTLGSISGYDVALSADQIEWMAENGTTVLPEPTALALLALGVAGVALRRRAA